MIPVASADDARGTLAERGGDVDLLVTDMVLAQSNGLDLRDDDGQVPDPREPAP
jgi:hypothetical protein